MMPENAVKDFGWRSAAGPDSCNYVTPSVIRFLLLEKPSRVLDIGCGNGNLCKSIRDNTNAYVVGVDNDAEGIRIATQAYPEIPFYNFGVQDNHDHLLKQEKGLFDVTISTEVIEHLYDPKLLLQYAYNVLKPNGKLLITTPYHGYLKNCAIALFNKWDLHHAPLKDGGHIKFWSKATLSALLESNGFKVIGFSGVGRISYFWKSMVIICQKHC